MPFYENQKTQNQNGKFLRKKNHYVQHFLKTLGVMFFVPQFSFYRVFLEQRKVLLLMHQRKSFQIKISSQIVPNPKIDKNFGLESRILTKIILFCKGFSILVSLSFLKDLKSLFCAPIFHPTSYYPFVGTTSRKGAISFEALSW